MKKCLFSTCLVLMAMAGLASCGDDSDDRDIDRNDVPASYTEALKAKFPDAVNVKWEKTPGYYIAEFSKPQQEYDVWYGPGAEWAMTEVGYGHNLFFLPPVVDAALAESEYGKNHTVEDVTMYERTDRTFYIIEVEPMGGGADTYLYYAPDGTLVKTMTQDVDITPDTQL